MKKILIEPSRSVDLCKDMMSSVCMFIAQYAVSNHDLPVYPSSSVMDHVNTFIVILQQDTTILNTRQYHQRQNFNPPDAGKTGLQKPCR
jgi:hypothetical protein